MKKLELILIVLISGMLKMLPLLAGIFILNTFGYEVYSNFAYMTVFAVMFTVIISAGVSPTLIKEVLSKTELDRHHVIERYFSVSSITTVLLCFFSIFIFVMFTEHKTENLFAMYMLAISVVIYSLFLPLSQSLGKSKQMVLISALLVVMVFLSMVYSLMITPIYILELYSFSYLIFSSILIVFLCKSGLITKNVFDQVCVGNYVKNIKLIFESVIWIFIPNALWMLSLFIFHSVIKNGAITKDSYAMFALGYQFFSILVFIPNSLSPVIMRMFIVMRDNSGVFSALKISALYVLTSLSIVSISALIAVCFFSYELNTIKVIVATSFAGVFSAGVAPLSQYLVAKSVPYLLIPSVVVFCALLFVLYAFDPGLFYLWFCVAYAASYFTLILMCLFKKGF